MGLTVIAERYDLSHVKNCPICPIFGRHVPFFFGVPYICFAKCAGSPESINRKVSPVSLSRDSIGGALSKTKKLLCSPRHEEGWLGAGNQKQAKSIFPNISPEEKNLC